MSATSNSDDFSKTLKTKWLQHARSKGLLDLSVRPPKRYCPNHHELPDEHGVRHGTPVWIQIEECPTCRSQQQKALIMDKIIERFGKCGVPEMFQCWTTGTTSTNRTNREPLLVDEDNYAARCASARYPQTPWIMFCGTVGVGKTTWASALFCDTVDLSELMPGEMQLLSRRSSGINALWMSEADLFMKCDEEHHRDGYNARTAYLSKVCKSQLLLLDDLGGSRRNLTEWQGGALRHLFDHRHKHRLPTLLTSNMTNWKQFADRYGDHVVSRMLDLCGNMTVLSGEDRRI